MKKLISTTLILCMLVSLIPFSTVFATGQAEEPSLVKKVAMSCDVTVETKNKPYYILNQGRTYYVKPRTKISSSVAYTGPTNLANVNVWGSVETYSFANELISSDDNTSLATVNFQPDTYKIITPTDGDKKLYVNDVVAYRWEDCMHLRIPSTTNAAVKVTESAAVNFPHFLGIYYVFDKNNTLVDEGMTSGSTTLSPEDSLYVINISSQSVDIPIQTTGEITLEEASYYMNLIENKEFTIEGESNLTVSSKSKFKAILQDIKEPVERAIEWFVKDPSVATVSNDGVVTPKSDGKTTVVAKYSGTDKVVAEKEITVGKVGIGDLAFDFKNYSVEKFDMLACRAVYDSWLLASGLRSEGDGGVCSGMSQTALLIQQNVLNVNNYGADKISKISTPNERLKNRIAFQHMLQGQFSGILHGPTIKNQKKSNKNKFDEIVQKTIAFSETGKQPIVLTMRNDTQKVGHAVVPYAVDDTDSTHTKILFYDPNVTYSSSINSQAGGYRYLKLYKSNGEYTGKWQIMEASGGVHGLRYETKFNTDLLDNPDFPEDVYLSYYPFTSIILTMGFSNLYSSPYILNIGLFSESESEETTYLNLTRSLKDFTLTDSESAVASVKGYTLTSAIEEVEYCDNDSLTSPTFHRLILPYDTYTVQGETDEAIELNLANDYVLSAIKSKDNSEVSFKYADSNSNPEIKIVSASESDSFSVENKYFDSDLKYDNLLFTGTQENTLSIVPEETGFAVTGAKNLTFTATVSDTPVSVSADNIAAGETIHIVIDGRNIAITDSASAELASSKIGTRSSTDKPVAFLEGGEYTEAQTLTFEDVDDDTVIYYTTDGSTPDEESSIYYGPITIDRSMKVRAKAKKYGYNMSSTLSLNYTLPEVSIPTVSTAAGYYFNTQKIRLTSETEGAQIYYTTDGSDPRDNGTLYTTPVSIDKSCTLRVYAKAGTCTSETADFEYTIDIDGVYVTHYQSYDGVVTATVEQALDKEITLIAAQYDDCNKLTGISLRKETLPEGENLISFDSGLTGENVCIYVWDDVTPIPVY